MQAAILAMELPPREDAAIRDLIGLSWQDALVRLYPDIDHADALRPDRRVPPPRPAAGGTDFAAVQGRDHRACRGCSAMATGWRWPPASRAPGSTRRCAPTDVLRRCSWLRAAPTETASKPDPRMLKEIACAPRLRRQRGADGGRFRIRCGDGRAIDMRVLGWAAACTSRGACCARSGCGGG